MTKKEFLGVYALLAPHDPFSAMAKKYYFVRVFNEDGSIEFEALNEVYSELKGVELEHRQYIGPFDSIDELSGYLYRLTELLAVKRCGILSLNDFNIGLTEIVSHPNSSELTSRGKFELFFQKADVLENVDAKKNLFHRFFKA